MPKKIRVDLVKLVKCIEPKLLVDKVRSNVEEQFSDSNLTLLSSHLPFVPCFLASQNN